MRRECFEVALSLGGNHDRKHFIIDRYAVDELGIAKMNVRFTPGLVRDVVAGATNGVATTVLVVEDIGF